MKIGYNYPWGSDKYGFNFGPGINPPVWKDSLPKNLALLQDMGISVVRWFILGNCYNYGPAPVLQEGSFSDSYRFTPPAVPDPSYFDHFELLLKTFKDSGTGIQLIPSFCDFGMSIYPGFDAQGHARGSGRGDLIDDPAKRDVFFKTMLDKFLSISKRYQDQIYAWEVMNEPIWLCKNCSPPVYQTWHPHPYLHSKDNMIEFLRLAVSHINWAGFRSTVGHRYFEDFAFFGSTCTGTLKQFHFYPRKFHGYNLPSNDTEELPAFAETNAILGEFCTRRPTNQEDPWSECKGQDLADDNVVKAHLDAIQQKGYELALIWPDLDNPADDGLKFSPAKQAIVKAYPKS
jgi:hypothetical protein